MSLEKHLPRAVSLLASLYILHRAGFQATLHTALAFLAVVAVWRDRRLAPLSAALLAPSLWEPASGLAGLATGLALLPGRRELSPLMAAASLTILLPGYYGMVPRVLDTRFQVAMAAAPLPHDVLAATAVVSVASVWNIEPSWRGLLHASLSLLIAAGVMAVSSPLGAVSSVVATGLGLVALIILISD